MNREIITMDEYGKVFLPYSDGIWMRETKLTDLFGVIAPTFRTAVKAVYKNGALKDYNTVTNAMCQEDRMTYFCPQCV